MQPCALFLAAAASLCLASRAAPVSASPTAPDDARDAAALALAASEAEALGLAIESSSEHMRHLLRRARTQKWARAVGCLDEALSRVDVALRVAREEVRATREAVRGGDANAARGHLARVMRLRETARAAASSGQMCAAGPELQAFEGTSVRLIVDPTIAPVTP